MRLSLSLLGLILWYITKVGNMAILFSILADGLALLPTIRKTYLDPETENGWMWFAGAVGASLTLLTIKVWSLPNYGFPLYIFISDLIVFTLAKFKRGKIRLA